MFKSVVNAVCPNQLNVMLDIGFIANIGINCYICSGAANGGIIEGKVVFAITVDVIILCSTIGNIAFCIGLVVLAYIHGLACDGVIGSDLGGGVRIAAGDGDLIAAGAGAVTRDNIYISTRVYPFAYHFNVVGVTISSVIVIINECLDCFMC